MDTAALKLKAILKENHYSGTRSRLTVFNELAQNSPIHTSDLAKRLKQKTDRATVYRTVELFERLGVVNRVWQGFTHQIELSEIFTPHHHHAVCQNCNKTFDILSTELESALTTLAKKYSFIAVQHSVELTGYCKNCQ